MIVRRRVRAVLVPLFFYAALGAASAYLVRNAARGQHGSEARVAFDKEKQTLESQLAMLVDDRERWRRRVDALRNESIDRDLLDETARGRLNRAAKDDVLIFTGSSGR